MAAVPCGGSGVDGDAGVGAEERSCRPRME